MSCARIDPYSDAKVGDWKINDLIVRVNPVLPHDPSMCKDQLQVTKEVSRGKYFCMDKACAKAFFRVDEGKKLPKSGTVKHQNGKTGKLYISEDSSFCGCTCARWEPKDE